MEPPNIRDLAKMAQLSVTDEEVRGALQLLRAPVAANRRCRTVKVMLQAILLQVKAWEPQLQQIVSWCVRRLALDADCGLSASTAIYLLTYDS